MENAIEYKNDYLVYSDGRVWRNPRSLTRKDGVVRNFKGSWVATRIRNQDCDNGGGYEYVDLYFSQRKEYWLVHRLVAKLFIPNPSNLPQVNHKNGIRSDNRVENLEWVTCSENHIHALYELNSNRKSKLTQEQMKEVYDLRNIQNKPLREIADQYGISPKTVSEISKGKRRVLQKEGKIRA